MMHGEAAGGAFVFAFGMLLLWAFLAVLHYINPVLPVTFLMIFWGVSLGIVIGVGGHIKLVLLHCLIWPLMLGYIGYEHAGWTGTFIALLQFANMLDFALMIGFAVWLSIWKVKKEVATQSQ